MTDCSIIKNETHYIVHINDLSNDLKLKIRENLTQICHGLSNSKTPRATYSYKSTLSEFINRYNDKTEKIKKGMIGELLAHLFLSELNSDFSTVSPFFNLEERSIKKGFDIVLYEKENNDLWITEVKSGELHKNKNTNQTNNILLDKAKDDLKTRLNEPNTTLWINAINGAKIAMDNYPDVKKAVVNILGEVSDSTIHETQTGKDKNVILVSSLFAPLSEKIEEKELQKCYERYEKENIFNNILILSIQKETYTKIVNFLIEEGKTQ